MNNHHHHQQQQHPHVDQEFQSFFNSIGLESWIKPLINLGVTSLKFFYLNFNDILDEDEIELLRSNRLHVKIIMKKLKAKFESNNNNSDNPSTIITNSNQLVTDSSLNFNNNNSNSTHNNNEDGMVIPKLEPSSPEPILVSSNIISTELQSNSAESSSSQYLFYDESQQQQQHSNQSPIQNNRQLENFNPNPNDILLKEIYLDFGMGPEKVIKLHVEEPVNPEQNRFLEDWRQYGQIRFFDTANFLPNIPKNVLDYMIICNVNNNFQDRQSYPLSFNSKDYETMKEILCQNLFQQMTHYFIWRMPIRLLHTVVDRLIHFYPFWDDGTPTKTDTIKKRILDKYAHFRRYKVPPEWVEHKYFNLTKLSQEDGENGDISINKNYRKKRPRKSLNTTTTNNNGNDNKQMTNQTTTPINNTMIIDNSNDNDNNKNQLLIINHQQDHNPTPSNSTSISSSPSKDPISMIKHQTI